MIHLRPARSTDAGKLGAVLSEFTAQTHWMPYLHTGAEDIALAGRLIDRGWVTVAEWNGKVAGFVACNKSELDALYVAAAARGQGVGSALLSYMQKIEPKLELWTFQANTQAQKFYLKHGFKEVTRTDGKDNDERLPDIKYGWKQGAQA